VVKHIKPSLLNLLSLLYYSIITHSKTTGVSVRFQVWSLVDTLGVRSPSADPAIAPFKLLLRFRRNGLKRALNRPVKNDDGPNSHPPSVYAVHCRLSRNLFSCPLFAGYGIAGNRVLSYPLYLSRLAVCPFPVGLDIPVTCSRRPSPISSRQENHRHREGSKQWQARLQDVRYCWRKSLVRNQ